MPSRSPYRATAIMGRMGKMTSLAASAITIALTSLTVGCGKAEPKDVAVGGRQFRVPGNARPRLRPDVSYIKTEDASGCPVTLGVRLRLVEVAPAEGVDPGQRVRFR